MSSEPAYAEDDDTELEELPDDDVAYDALQDVLEEMSSVYHHDNETINVIFASRSAAMPDGETVTVESEIHKDVDPPCKGPNILRVLDNLLSHEVAHVNWSDLDAKSEFSDCYPGWGQIPGWLNNLLEDQYIDHRRKQKWYGLRDKMAYHSWLQMQTEHLTPPVSQVEEEEGYTDALLAALFHYHVGGYIKGLDGAEHAKEYANFVNDAKPIFEEIRQAHDPEDRFELSHTMMQLFIRYAPDPDDVNEDNLNDMDNGSHSGEEGDREPERSPYSDEPEVDMPDSVREAVEERIEEMMDDGDFPDPDDVSSTDEADDELSGDDSDASESEQASGGDGGESAADGESESGESERGAKPDDTDSTTELGDIDELLNDRDTSSLKVVN